MQLPCQGQVQVQVQVQVLVMHLPLIFESIVMPRFARISSVAGVGVANIQ